MPDPLAPFAGTTSQGSVLLLEGYDALAIAIGSALKKFAPRHTLVVAPSLAEARLLVRKATPDLFIIDFDPPYADFTEFLHEMQNACPTARALVIAPGVSPEIAAESRKLSGLQFIGKPFELADFGATVQALLAPSESANSRGTLRSLSLPDIVMLHCAGGTTRAVEVKDTAGHSGVVHILDGQIAHAETGGRTGVAALERMFSWSDTGMSERERPASAPRTIHGPWAVAFLEAWRGAMLQKPPEILPAKQAPPKTGKKIVVIDDTEMLLVFVEDTLATADPNFQITTAHTGADGIKEIAGVLPDLVLLDYSLPDLNGDEVCRRLLQNERTADIPILMMSAHTAEMTAAAARRENIVATIAKPFLSEALVDLVRRILAGERPRKPLAKPPVADPPAPPAPKPFRVEPVESSHGHGPGEAKRSESTATPVPKIIPPPPIQAVQPSVTAAPEDRAAPLPYILSGQNVVLGLFLEVVSMQFTPQLRMGTVRARPSSFTVSLFMPSAGVSEKFPPKTGFQLGRTELDASGHIATLRLIPTFKPFQPAPTRNAFEIGEVALIPAQARQRLELISSPAATMRMQLLAELELLGVKLSPSFQIAQLILKWRSNTVRVTFSPNGTGGEKSGAAFETAAIQLDHSARIAELLLNPIK